MDYYSGGIVICILLAVSLIVIGFLFGKYAEQKIPKNLDGKFLISKTKDGKTIWRIDIDGDPNDLLNKTEILFKIYDCGLEEDESSGE